MGVRGQGGGLDEPSSTAARNASMQEDPSNRRVFPNGHRLFVLQLIPLSSPQVVQTANGPAVVHAADFTPVTAAKPAQAGEILSLIATGLGPTQTVCPFAGGSGGTVGSTCPAGVTPLQLGRSFSFEFAGTGELASGSYRERPAGGGSICRGISRLHECLSGELRDAAGRCCRCSDSATQRCLGWRIERYDYGPVAGPQSAAFQAAGGGLLLAATS